MANCEKNTCYDAIANFRPHWTTWAYIMCMPMLKISNKTRVYNQKPLIEHRTPKWPNDHILQGCMAYILFWHRLPHVWSSKIVTPCSDGTTKGSNNRFSNSEAHGLKPPASAVAVTTVIFVCFLFHGKKQSWDTLCESHVAMGNPLLMRFYLCFSS